MNRASPRTPASEEYPFYNAQQKQKNMLCIWGGGEDVRKHKRSVI